MENSKYKGLGESVISDSQKRRKEDFSSPSEYSVEYERIDKDQEATLNQIWALLDGYSHQQASDVLTVARDCKINCVKSYKC